MKQMTHYDKHGDYAGHSTEGGPHDCFGVLIMAAIVMVAVGLVAIETGLPWWAVCFGGWMLWPRKK